MGMVPVRAVLVGIPAVQEGFSGWNESLAQTRHSVRPGSIQLLNAVEMYRGAIWEVIVHDELDIIVLVDIQLGSGKLSIGENAVASESVRRNRSPGKVDLEANCAGRT